MRFRSGVLALAITIQCAAPVSLAQASPWASIRWQDCEGPSAGAPPNQNFEGPGEYRIVVMAGGFEGPVRGHEIYVAIKSLQAELPDAWRFDDSGCQAGRWSAVWSSAGKTCPPLALSPAASYASLTYENGRARIRLAATYPARDTEAATTYTLGQIVFDHTSSAPGYLAAPDQCSCVNRPVAVYTLPGANRLDFGDGSVLELSTQNDFVIWNDPNNVSGWPYHCDLCTKVPPDTVCTAPTPSQRQTWGDIKDRYR